MPTKAPQAKKLLEIMRQRRLVRYRDLLPLGVSSKTLARMVQQGEATKDGLGYRLTESPPLNELEQIAARFPEAVACLETAQHLHDLHDGLASFSVVALPRTAPRNKNRISSIPGLKVISWRDPRLYTLGVASIDLGGISILCTDRYRTAADMWRPEHKQDIEHAQKALLRIYLDEGRDGLEKVASYALTLGWFPALDPRISLIAATAEAVNVRRL